LPLEEQLNNNSPSHKFWSTDRIVSISAIFVSLLTLFTFINQNSLLQKQAALSVLPYLAISTSYDNGDNPSYKLTLANRGVGPAIIESQMISYEGKEYKEDFSDFLKVHIPNLDSLGNISKSTFEFGHVLPSGDDLYLIAIFDDIESVNLIAGTLERLDDTGLKYEIIYRSIYGERWKITESSELPIKLPALK